MIRAFKLSHLVQPAREITDPEQIFKVKALLFFTLAFIVNLGVGIIKSPPFVTPALVVAFPIVVLSYFLARTKHYRLAGLMSISATFLICFLLIFILETESYYRHSALIWITVTIFMGSIWMTFRSVIILTVVQLVFSILVAVFGKNMELPIFASWMPLNIFFIVINLSTRWVLEQHHLVIHNNSLMLERTVEERTSELRTNLEERDELLKELYHRTKNNMQVIASLLIIQSTFLDDSEAKRVLHEMRSRILSMALVHEKLYKSKDLHAIDISDYIEDLINEIHSIYVLDSKPVKMDLDLEKHKLPLEKAVPIGLVLHELIVNIYKYALVDDNDLVVKVACRVNENGGFRFEVEDNGVGFPDDFDPSSGKSLGTLVVKNIIENQLNGSITFENSMGAKVSFDIPLKEMDFS